VVLEVERAGFSRLAGKGTRAPMVEFFLEKHGDGYRSKNISIEALLSTLAWDTPYRTTDGRGRGPHPPAARLAQSD